MRDRMRAPGVSGRGFPGWGSRGPYIRPGPRWAVPWWAVLFLIIIASGHLIALSPQTAEGAASPGAREAQRPTQNAGGAQSLSGRIGDRVLHTDAELSDALALVLAKAFPGRTPLWEASRPHPFDRLGAAGFELLTPENLKGGRNWFQLRTAAGAQKSYLLPIDLYWEDSVWVATRGLPAGHCVEAGDLTRRLCRHTFAPQEVRLDPAPLGLCVEPAVNIGAIITRALLRPPHLVERGRIVRLIYRSTGLFVSARAEALENGALGEAIRVRPLDARRICQAVVRGAEEVEVLLP